MNAPAKVPPQQIKPEDQALTMLADPQLISQIGRALPKHFAPDRMVRIAMTELRKVPKLRQCDPYSFIGAVMQCAQLGLEPGSGLGHAYLIPYGKECTLIIGYKGKAELMRRGGVEGLMAEIVRKGDIFRYGIKASVPYLDWEPGADAGGLLSRIFNRKDQVGVVTHVFASGQLRGGGRQQIVMTTEEINEIRDVVLKKAFKPELSPWNNFWGEMAKKTALHRLSKLMPQSPEFVRLEELNNAAESGEQFRMTLQPLIEAGVVAPDYDPTPEQQEPIETPMDKEKAARTRATITDEFRETWAKAKAAGLSLGDGLKILGMEAVQVEKQPTAEIENAIDILNHWIEKGAK